MRFNERLLNDLGISKADLATLRVILNNNNELGTMAIQDADNVNIDGGSIDDTVIGSATAAEGTFTVIVAVTIAGTITTAAQPNITGLGTIANLVAASVDINGGTIDNTAIGVATPAAGNFSTVDIDAGNIDDTVIGASTPAAGNFSTVDIDGGNIDGTPIGATTKAAGNFSIVDIDSGNIDGTVIGAASKAAGNFSTVDIDAGTIDNTSIGATTPLGGEFTFIKNTSAHTHSSTTGITANAGGGQGSATQLVNDICEISTVSTTGDSVKVPAAAAGLRITIINNGANACDVFPSSGNDIGAGSDTAISLAASANITYASYSSTQWASLA